MDAGLPSLFEVCTPRGDVRQGQIVESDFAADLAQVIRGQAPPAYQDPQQFFAHTHPTRGLRQLLTSVCQRLQGSHEQVGAIFRLDTSYGGGKTHALIALWHILGNPANVSHLSEFIDPALLPRQRVQVAAFDGENADPLNGRQLAPGILARTPWGEIAWALAGQEGYERVRASDQAGIAPGAETLRELFGDRPTLILLDELAIYLRKQKGTLQQRGAQLAAFLTALFKAVESSPQAVVVYTLAIGKEGKAIDAYAEENQAIANMMAELSSISARKATLLDPTGEDETVKVLRRRLFEQIDDAQAKMILQAYQQVWQQHKEVISYRGDVASQLEAFQKGFPLHPELIQTLREKTATLSNFQRVRGMLRLLARTVAQLWQEQPTATYAIHLHHLDPSNPLIRTEITVRLGQHQFQSAIAADVGAVPGEPPALAQALDRQFYRGLPPYHAFVARAILWHSLAFNDPLKGLTREQLRYSLLGPGLDVSFIDDAVRRFVQESAYLDDRPNAPLRFATEPNLTQLIRRHELQVDPGQVRSELNDQIRQSFEGGVLQLIPFPAGPHEVPDDTNNGKPYLVVIGYDAEAVTAQQVQVPPLVQRLFLEKGGSGAVRLNRNHLVFLCVDAEGRDRMQEQMRHYLAIRELLRSPTFAQLPDYQQTRLKDRENQARSNAIIAVQQAYRHLFYPSAIRLEGATVDLAHAVIEGTKSAEAHGRGQKPILQVLRESNKLRLPEDAPDGPTYIRDKTPLRQGKMSTAALRLEFYRDPKLPMLVGDEVFLRGIIQGIEAGVFVYQFGDLLWGQGDAAATLKIDENAYVYTTSYATEQGIWPRSPAPSPSVITYSPSPERSGTVNDRPTSTIAPDVSPTLALPQHTFVAEAPLREALTQIWEQARAANVRTLASLEIRLYDPNDAFVILAYVRQLPETKTTVSWQGNYQTAAGSQLDFKYEGDLNDLGPVKDFVAAQMRAASEKELHATYAIAFSKGLELTGNAPEQVTERLCRQGVGAAYVRASASIAT